MKYFSLFALAASCLSSAGFAKSTSQQAETVWTVPPGTVTYVTEGQPLFFGTPLVLDGFKLSDNGFGLNVKKEGNYLVTIALNVAGISSLPECILHLQGSSDKGTTWSDLATTQLTTDSSHSIFSVHLEKGTFLQLELTGINGSMGVTTQVLDVQIYENIQPPVVAPLQ